jgi:acetyl-CoA carboxylase biotin carboxyl carrier protein
MYTIPTPRPLVGASPFGSIVVADDKRDSPRPFDVRTVEYLLKLMAEHDLSEIELKEGDRRIRLRKGSAIPGALIPAPTPAPAANPGVHAPKPPEPLPTPARKLLEIKSPMVGTFYSRPKPDRPDYVSVGAAVRADTVVCLIEAMKLYNDIKAEVSGTIAEVCVNNGDFVEFNQVLFRVEPT